MGNMTSDVLGHPDAATVLRQFYASLLRNDFLAAAGCLTSNVVLHVPGRNALSGDYVGADGLRCFTEASSRLAEGESRIELLDLLQGDTFTAALCHVTGRRHDRAPLDNRTIHLARLEAGRIAEIWFHNYDQHLVDAFWGSRH
jgi:ketosteroid isomerase-like protein